jgi:uncharacterized protein YjlB
MARRFPTTVSEVQLRGDQRRGRDRASWPPDNAHTYAYTHSTTGTHLVVRVLQTDQLQIAGASGRDLRGYAKLGISCHDIQRPR